MVNERQQRQQRLQGGDTAASKRDEFIPPHGGYKHLFSYQKAEIVYDATVYFCGRFLDKRDRTYDQMIQATRSGKQNIIEGSIKQGGLRERMTRTRLAERDSQQHRRM